jgi:hypothetical protein
MATDTPSPVAIDTSAALSPTLRPTRAPAPRKATHKPTPHKTTHKPAQATGVHPGAFCSPPGAYGRTVKGTLMQCKGPGRPRWRAA